MRIIFSVLGLLLVVGLVGVSAWQINEVGFLWWEANKLRNDVALLKQTFVAGDYGKACMDEDYSGNKIAGMQLRFTDASNYVIEPVCEVPVPDNVIYASGKLANGVTRLYGSGIMLSRENPAGLFQDAWVHLTRGDRVMAVGIFDNQAQVKSEAKDLEIGGTSPAWANCSDWGFTCCNSTSGVGEGVQANALDCANQCFQKCNLKPEILLFNSHPQINPVDRTVRVGGTQETIVFGYQVTDDTGIAQVSIDFGDGETYESSEEKQAEVSHQYRCFRSSCAYTAKISTIDNSGLVSPESMASKIKILMR